MTGEWLSWLAGAHLDFVDIKVSIWRGGTYALAFQSQNSSDLAQPVCLSHWLDRHSFRTNPRLKSVIGHDQSDGADGELDRDGHRRHICDERAARRQHFQVSGRG